MSKYIVAGVGVVNAFTTGDNPQLILTSSTAQEQSLSLSVTSEDIRGGLSNALLGRYFHDSLLESTITDAMFDLNYIALNAGGTVVANNDSIVTEEVTVGAGGAITVQGTPTNFGSQPYGWVKKVGTDEWQTVIFTGKNATTTLSATDVACVKYNSNDTAMKYFTVSANVIPSIVHLYMTYPLFAGGSTTDISSQTQIGELIIDIPKFQFNGTVDMSLTSSGAATSNLSGQALASYSGESCDDMGQYGTIKQKLYNSTWYSDLKNMFVDDAQFSLAVGGTKLLNVYGVYSNGVVGYIPNDKLSFAADSGGKVSVSNSGDTKGTVTAVSAGTGYVTITVAGSGAPAVEAVASVTVTSA